MKTSYCFSCCETIFFDPSKSYGKFCNNQCQAEYFFENDVKPRVEAGLCRTTSTLRNYIGKTRGYSCELCSVSSWMNKVIVLHVDHVDGNADNNFPSNIRLLCPNCHSQTETYCARNKKNSKRSIYNQRYRLKKLQNF